MPISVSSTSFSPTDLARTCSCSTASSSLFASPLPEFAGPLVVSSVSSLVSLSSDVDVIFYEIGEKGAIARTNAAGHSIKYPERE